MRYALFSLRPKDAIGSRRTEGEWLRAHRVGQRQMIMSFERRDCFRKEGDETLDADAIRRLLCNIEGVLYGATIDGLVCSGERDGNGSLMVYVCVCPVTATNATSISAFSLGVAHWHVSWTRGTRLTGDLS
jgi:hypothetical protein